MSGRYASCWNAILFGQCYRILNRIPPLNSATDNKRVLIKVYLCVDQLNSIQKNVGQKIFQVVYLVSAENLLTVLV